MEAVDGIIYPYALDKAGLVVKAVDAPRTEIYSCIACGERMVLRRGEIKRPYFAHYTENPTCKPETVLHMMAKDIIKAGLDTAIKMKYEYPFTWHCPICDQEHKGNLALSPREVKTEVSLDGVRPDILVSSTNGKPLVAIEVVVTHSPEQEAIDAYKQLKLPVLLVEPGWEDLKHLSSGLGPVEAWRAPCRAKRCPKCGRILRHLSISSVEAYPCKKCGKRIRVIWPGGCEPYPEESRSKSMIAPASMVGVKLKWLKQPGFNHWYAYHICPYCGHPSSDVPIYTYDLNMAMENYPQPDRTAEFYYCETCDIWIEKKGAANSMTAPKPLTPERREKGTRNE